MTVKTGEKRHTTTRAASLPPTDPMERALIVHTLAQNIYQHLAQRYATPFGGCQAPPIGFHAAGPFVPPARTAGFPGPWTGIQARQWNQDLPLTPPHFPGSWGG